MNRLWWRLVFLLSLFNIVLFVFHFTVLLVSNEDDKKCENRDHKPADNQVQNEVIKQQISTENTELTRIGRSWSAKQLDKERFTIVILTHSRTTVLLDLLSRYSKAVASGKLPQLSKILVVWNNIGAEPPSMKSLGPQTVPIVFLKQKENRLTNRFRVFPDIDTEAIFSQDDDIYASPLDLKYSFNVFKKFPTKLVGFYARKHTQRADGFYLYSSNPRQNTYSMILTGACFIHIAYLEMFQKQPKAILNTIDELMNGEDIAMNMMISNHTKDTAGYYVKPVFLGTIKSVLKSGETLHVSQDHIFRRSRCINELKTFYGMSLRLTNIAFEQYLYTWKQQNGLSKPKTTTKKIKNSKN